MVSIVSRSLIERKEQQLTLEVPYILTYFNIYVLALWCRKPTPGYKTICTYILLNARHSRRRFHQSTKSAAKVACSFQRITTQYTSRDLGWWNLRRRVLLLLSKCLRGIDFNITVWLPQDGALYRSNIIRYLRWVASSNRTLQSYSTVIVSASYLMTHWMNHDT